MIYELLNRTTGAKKVIKTEGKARPKRPGFDFDQEGRFELIRTLDIPDHLYELCEHH